MNILKIKDPQGNWVDIPALKGDKGDKGDPGISPTIDSTLSQANQAADAKAVGDKIDEITLTIDETLTQSGQVADAKVTGDTLNTKADQNGYYENLNVGVADQVASKNYIEDNEPYTFRPTANSAKVGTREFDTVAGGSIVWNQLIKNGNFAEKSVWTANNINFGDYIVENNVATFTVGAESVGVSSSFFANPGIKPKLNHVLFSSIDVKPSRQIGVRFMYNSMFDGTKIVTCQNDVWRNVANVIKCISDNSISSLVFYYNALLNIQENDIIQFRNANVFDLTQMFGSEIADYIYNLEQTTSGAGVAWFKKYFPKDYYEYNFGELMHVTNLQSHDMVGFNQWDEEWEVGTYNTSNGTPVTITSQIRSKNYIPVIPNSIYYFNKSTYMWILFYDKEKNIVSPSLPNTWQISNNARKAYASAKNLMTIPSNVHYLKFYMTYDYGATYNNDICINLSGTRNGEYEPYIKHSYPLDPSLTLKGIPKLVDGKLTYDGDIYKPDGTVERRYGIVDLGTLTWIYNSTANAFITTELSSSIKPTASDSDVPKFIQNKYNQLPRNQVTLGTSDKVICENITGSIVVSDLSYTNAEILKAAISGVYLVYELAEPTTETAQPYQSPQIIDPYGTEEYITTSIIPVGHQTQYPEDLRAKIESLPWDFANLIAPVEVTYIATQNYTAGSLFIVDNILYKATANIANGGTITPNTNCTATTLAEIIAAL